MVAPVRNNYPSRRPQFYFGASAAQQLIAPPFSQQAQPYRWDSQKFLPISLSQPRDGLPRARSAVQPPLATKIPTTLIWRLWWSIWGVLVLVVRQVQISTCFLSEVLWYSKVGNWSSSNIQKWHKIQRKFWGRRWNILDAGFQYVLGLSKVHLQIILGHRGKIF
jgi:hypothetical protein